MPSTEEREKIGGMPLRPSSGGCTMEHRSSGGSWSAHHLLEGSAFFHPVRLLRPVQAPAHHTPVPGRCVASGWRRWERRHGARSGSPKSTDTRRTSGWIEFFRAVGFRVWGCFHQVFWCFDVFGFACFIDVACGRLVILCITLRLFLR